MIHPLQRLGISLHDTQVTISFGAVGKWFGGRQEFRPLESVLEPRLEGLGMRLQTAATYLWGIDVFLKS